MGGGVLLSRVVLVIVRIGVLEILRVEVSVAICETTKLVSPT